MKNRLLVVDDSLAIHDDYARVFGHGPEAVRREEFEKLERLIFGNPEPKIEKEQEKFEVDRALQGEQALEMVEKAMVEARPYSVVFMDRFMPPGWDGIRTAKEVWQKAPDTQIVIVSAFADAFHSSQAYFKGERDHQLLFLRKPFDGIIIRHLAMCLVEKWRQAKQLKSLLEKSQAIELPESGGTDKKHRDFLVFLRLADEMAQPMLKAFQHGQSEALADAGKTIVRAGTRVPANPLLVCAKRIGAEAAQLETIGQVLQVYFEHLGILKQAWASA